MAQTLIQKSRRVSPAEKATFAVFGKKERDFFGLSEADESFIETELDRALAVNLDRQV